jgi:hypothetical protein
MGPPRFSTVRGERRKILREPKYCLVRLKFDDGSPALRGMVIDLCSVGARVSISATKEIPEQFTLFFPRVHRGDAAWCGARGKTWGSSFCLSGTRLNRAPARVGKRAQCR